MKHFKRAWLRASAGLAAALIEEIDRVLDTAAALPSQASTRQRS
jgi:hypothetical protein